MYCTATPKLKRGAQACKKTERAVSLSVLCSQNRCASAGWPSPLTEENQANFHDHRALRVSRIPLQAHDG
jgi:hypothetical protein